MLKYLYMHNIQKNYSVIYSNENLEKEVGEIHSTGRKLFYGALGTLVVTLILASVTHGYSTSLFALVLTVGVVFTLFLAYQSHKKSEMTIEKLRLQMMTEELGFNPLEDERLNALDKALFVNPDLGVIQRQVAIGTKMSIIVSEGRTSLHLACMFQPDFIKQHKTSLNELRVTMRDLGGNRPDYYLKNEAAPIPQQATPSILKPAAPAVQRQEEPPRLGIESLYDDSRNRATVHSLASIRCANFPEEGFADPTATDI